MILINLRTQNRANGRIPHPQEWRDDPRHKELGHLQPPEEDAQASSAVHGRPLLHHEIRRLEQDPGRREEDAGAGSADDQVQLGEVGRWDAAEPEQDCREHAMG